MDNYVLMKKLGGGPSGSVFLVQHKADGQQFAMKRIACGSESKANATLRDAMSLGKLQHPFVAKYKEFFVDVDDSDDNVFVHVVGEYHPCGDLTKLFKKRCKQQKPFAEPLIKKWFGQMVEALIFIHDREVVHGSLKPTNVYMTEDLNISIGDFGVSPSVTGSEASMAAAMAWTPPDDHDGGAKSGADHEGRKDVYALGCILLQLVTCHAVDETTMTSLLIQSKTDPRVLEDLLQQIMVSLIWIIDK